ncbi:cyclophilin-like domain-containing protein, partial [Hyaloraphidium curvatum]
QSVTLHTTLGDISIELFCEAPTPSSAADGLLTPRAQNFLALCASNYYDGCQFHRNIKGFIVQTGDPTNTGKGGTSIWGRKYEDEIKSTLKHNARGIVSMASSGPDTNASQFFIYAKLPQLDGKYTVFGKVIDGFDTLDSLEKLPVDDKYRPLSSDVRIRSITIHANPSGC